MDNLQFCLLSRFLSMIVVFGISYITHRWKVKVGPSPRAGGGAFLGASHSNCPVSQNQQDGGGGSASQVKYLHVSVSKEDKGLTATHHLIPRLKYYCGFFPSSHRSLDLSLVDMRQQMRLISKPKCQLCP